MDTPHILQRKSREEALQTGSASFKKQRDVQFPTSAAPRASPKYTDAVGVRAPTPCQKKRESMSREKV